MALTELERIANSLEQLLLLLERALPPLEVPQPPERKWGGDRITYVDEQALMALEQEDLRLKTRGVLPVSSEQEPRE